MMLRLNPFAAPCVEDYAVAEDPGTELMLFYYGPPRTHHLKESQKRNQRTCKEMVNQKSRRRPFFIVLSSIQPDELAVVDDANEVGLRATDV
jgi:hypothetical protein